MSERDVRAAGRADVPRQRLGAVPGGRASPAPAWSCRGRTCRRRPSPTSSSRERGHPGRRRADDLDGRAAPARRARPLVAATGSCAAARRCPKSLSEAYREPDRPAAAAGVGHDRDQPDRVDRPDPQSPLAERAEDELADGAAPPGHDRARRRRADRRARTPARSCRGTARRRGELQVSGPWIARDYYHDPRASESFTDGRLAAHRRRGHHLARRATSAWSTGPRTSSSPAASGSARSSSRTRSWPTRRSPRRPSSPSPDDKWSERPLACVVRQARAAAHRGRGDRLAAAPGGQVVAARRRGVHRRGAEDVGRQVLEEGRCGTVSPTTGPSRPAPPACGR